MIFGARLLVTWLREKDLLLLNPLPHEKYAEKIYGLLSTTDEVEEEMSNDLASIKEVNTSLVKLSSHPGKDSDCDLWV